MRRPAVFPPPVLTVRVVRAVGLNNIHVAGLLRQQINPYVSLRIGEAKRRTPVVTGSTCPSWEGRSDASFKFELPRGRVDETHLELAIKDRNVLGRNEWLARYRLPLSAVPPSTGASGNFIRVRIALPCRRVRGSESVDNAYGTELTLELLLEDMHGWWEAEEAGLNREHSSVDLGAQPPPQPPPGDGGGGGGNCGNDTPLPALGAHGGAQRGQALAHAARVLFRANAARKEAQAPASGALLPPRDGRMSSSQADAAADAGGRNGPSPESAERLTETGPTLDSGGNTAVDAAAIALSLPVTLKHAA